MFFHPQSMRTEEGHDVFLQCVSGDSSPPAQISWLKNGRVLTKGNQIQVATELKHFYKYTDCYIIKYGYNITYQLQLKMF